LISTSPPQNWPLYCSWDMLLANFIVQSLRFMKSIQLLLMEVIIIFVYLVYFLSTNWIECWENVHIISKRNWSPQEFCIINGLSIKNYQELSMDFYMPNTKKSLENKEVYIARWNLFFHHLKLHISSFPATFGMMQKCCHEKDCEILSSPRIASFSKIVTLYGPIVSFGDWNLQSFVDVQD
jgi:hypothetical protein